MRIIAGLYRGRRLKTLPGLEVRPTPDRLRETLFDVLGSSVEGTVFIDGYAGCGAVGIEALSRGAGHVTWIEESAAACRVIRENLASLNIRSHADLLHATVRRGLRELEQRGLRARFCFLDPPYSERREYEQSLRWLGEHPVVESGGFVIVQHSKRELLVEKSGRLTRLRLLTQGSNALSFYRQDA